MAQKLRKHGKKLEKTSVGCDIDFTILLSMLKVKDNSEVPYVLISHLLITIPFTPQPLQVQCESGTEDFIFLHQQTALMFCSCFYEIQVPVVPVLCHTCYAKEKHSKLSGYI